MTSLPILRRELVVAARRPRTFWARVGAVFLGLCVGVYVFALNQSASAADMGRLLFWTFSTILSIYCLAGGFRLTADSLSSEKRDDTMGLLFLTDLKGYDVVLGKLAATSLNALYRLLALAPLLAIPFILGGVDWGMYGRVLLAVFNGLFFSLTAGLLASALSVREKRAASLGAGLVFGVNLIPAAIEIALALHRNKTPESSLLVLSPWYACYLAITSTTPLSRGMFSIHRYWEILGVTQAYAWFFLVASFWILPRSWQKRAEKAKTKGIREVLLRLTAGSEPVRNAWRTKCLNKNAYLWIAAREKRANLGFWLYLAILSGVWLFGLFKLKKTDWLEPATCVASAIALQLSFKLCVARKACEQFIEDRRAGAMELLLSTPLSVRDIIRGQWAGLRSYFGGPLVFLLLAEFILYLAPIAWGNHLTSKGDLIEWNWEALCNVIVMALDIWALIWVAMANSLTSPNAGKAAGKAVTRILVFPSILFLLFESVWQTFFHTIPGATTNILWWLGLSLIFDLSFGLLARRKLYSRFRELAVERFAPPRARWRLPFLPLGRRVAPSVTP